MNSIDHADMFDLADEIDEASRVLDRLTRLYMSNPVFVEAKRMSKILSRIDRSVKRLIGQGGWRERPGRILGE